MSSAPLPPAPPSSSPDPFWKFWSTKEEDEIKSLEERTQDVRSLATHEREGLGRLLDRAGEESLNLSYALQQLSSVQEKIQALMSEAEKKLEEYNSRRNFLGLKDEDVTTGAYNVIKTGTAAIGAFSGITAIVLQSLSTETRGMIVQWIGTGMLAGSAALQNIQSRVDIKKLQIAKLTGIVKDNKEQNDYIKLVIKTIQRSDEGLKRHSAPNDERKSRSWSTLEPLRTLKFISQLRGEEEVAKSPLLKSRRNLGSPVLV